MNHEPVCNMLSCRI